MRLRREIDGRRYEYVDVPDGAELAPGMDLLGTFRLVAPVGTADVEHCWQGRHARKPWQYKVTALLPHLSTPELLEACVGLLRGQTERPYIVVVDTGSTPAVCARIEQLRDADLEVHYVRAGGYTNSSEPVAVALDLGFARVNTPFIFLTHVDCFMRRRNAVAWLVGQCSGACPVVGFEMSSRSWVTDKWRGMVSHTFTALHAETMLRAGVTWHFERGRICNGTPKQYTSHSWPDTETAFNFALQERGIRPTLLGPEFNFQAQETEWWLHVRSSPGMAIYGGGPEEYRKAQPAILAKALADARERAARWKRGEP